MLATYLGSATYRETQARAERGATWVLAGNQSTPLTAGLAAAAVAWELTPVAEYMPMSQFQDMLTKRVSTFIAQDLLATNLKAISKEVETRGKDRRGELPRFGAVPHLIGRSKACWHAADGAFLVHHPRFSSANANTTTWKPAGLSARSQRSVRGTPRLDDSGPPVATKRMPSHLWG